mmetsp:Transcript_22161/g.52457  ORF Transcript_22161/g.52457 Transcript_22161/m.52457 type:complete len:359 (-) Transcript_22161:163-1239(-)
MGEVKRCMADLPPTRELIGLKIPFGAWEPDTLITDTYGNPIFSVLDVQHQAMGAYEAIFGDENGHKLCYVKRRLITKSWLDGWDFCSYSPNFVDQPKYKERDMYGKSVYPFSFLSIRPTKCRYNYSVHNEDMERTDTHLEAMHGWLGSMTVCCTPMVRFGKWQIDFHRPGAGDPEINIDQSKNLLEVERGNDLLAALCIAYAFDKALCQPMVTIVGYQEKEHLDDDDDSLEDFDPTVISKVSLSSSNLVSQSYRTINSRGYGKDGSFRSTQGGNDGGYYDNDYADKDQEDGNDYVDKNGQYDEYGEYYNEEYDEDYNDEAEYDDDDDVSENEEEEYVDEEEDIEEDYEEFLKRKREQG